MAMDSVRSSYEAQMRCAARSYSDVTATLLEHGLPASFTQTGGMCAAIEIRLERGALLVTDASEVLPWTPQTQCGWGVGYYPSEDACDGPTEYVEDPADTSIARLLELVRECLGLVARTVAHS